MAKRHGMGELAVITRINVSYGQLCVFDPALDKPFNDWTREHVKQGFAYRPGSVSFATGQDGEGVVVIRRAEQPPSLHQANVAIVVPFDVEAPGRVEVGSISSSVVMEVGTGQFALYFVDHGGGATPNFELVFVPDDAAAPAVLKEGPTAAKMAAYLLDAHPA